MKLKLKTLVAFGLCFAMFTANGVPTYAQDSNVEHLKEDETNDVIDMIKVEYVDQYNSMTKDEIEQKLLTISESYFEGDVLSESDSAFILLNSKETQENSNINVRAGKSSKYYSKSKTQYGVSASLSGTMKQNICFVAGSSTFGGTSNVTINSGSAKNVKLEIFHTAYGLVGTSAPYVGVLYNGNVSMSNSNTSSTVKMDKEKNYGSILPVYTTMYSRATITTSSGNEFTILSDTWKKFQ